MNTSDRVDAILATTIQARQRGSSRQWRKVNCRTSRVASPRLDDLTLMASMRRRLAPAVLGKFAHADRWAQDPRHASHQLKFETWKDRRRGRRGPPDAPRASA